MIKNVRFSGRPVLRPSQGVPVYSFPNGQKVSLREIVQTAMVQRAAVGEALSDNEKIQELMESLLNSTDSPVSLRLPRDLMWLPQANGVRRELAPTDLADLCPTELLNAKATPENDIKLLMERAERYKSMATIAFLYPANNPAKVQLMKALGMPSGQETPETVATSLLRAMKDGTELPEPKKPYGLPQLLEVQSLTNKSSQQPEPTETNNLQVHLVRPGDVVGKEPPAWHMLRDALPRDLDVSPEQAVKTLKDHWGLIESYQNYPYEGRDFDHNSDDAVRKAAEAVLREGTWAKLRGNKKPGYAAWSIRNLVERLMASPDAAENNYQIWGLLGRALKNFAYERNLIRERDSANQLLHAAVSCTQAAILRNPQDPYLHMMLGDIRMALKDNQRAAEAYRIALDLPYGPQNSILHDKLTQALLELGRYQEALVVSQKGLKMLKPAKVQSLSTSDKWGRFMMLTAYAKAHCMAGVHAQGINTDDRENHLERAVAAGNAALKIADKLDKNTRPAKLYYLGLAKAELAHMKEGTEAIDEEIEEAIKHLEQARQDSNSNPPYGTIQLYCKIRLELAKLQAEIGRNDKAIFTLSEISVKARNVDIPQDIMNKAEGLRKQIDSNRQSQRS